MGPEAKTCQNCKNKFPLEPEDFGFYEKIKVPAPTWCPDCRFQRRLSWIAGKNLYKRRIGGKNLISMYSEDKPFKVMEDREWWSDAHDFLEYGQDYDFSKPFFVQFRNLMETVPLPHLQRDYATMHNSDYCNAASALKNCYLLAQADHDENCGYGWSVENTKDSFDLTYVNKSELCYEGTDLKNCYRCVFSDACEDSHDLYFSKDCIGCQHCLGCIGLRGKSYHIFNQPYSKEEYEAKLKTLDISSRSGFQKTKADAEAFFLFQPRKFMHERLTDDVSGDYIYQARDVHHTFTAEKAEHCKYCFQLRYVTNGTTNSYDYSVFGVGADLMYECAWCGLDSSGLKFCFWDYASQDQTYCFGCHGSKNLFGCIGLRHKQYCILNKQYSKEEYETLVAKIIDHMNTRPFKDAGGAEYRYGEFFPMELSPFAYNETIAQQFFPLVKESAHKRSLAWKEADKRDYGIDIEADRLPDNSKDIPPDIDQKVIGCEHKGSCAHGCTEAFRLIPLEVQFYKRMELPLPRLCPTCRHYERFERRNPPKLWKRQCTCAGLKSENGSYANTIRHFHEQTRCPNSFETSYAPDRPEIVYCEQCYQAEVA